MLLKGNLDVAAEGGWIVKGRCADEGEEGTNVGEFVLDGRACEAPAGICMERSAGLVKCCCWAADDVCCIVVGQLVVTHENRGWREYKFDLTWRQQEK